MLEQSTVALNEVADVLDTLNNLDGGVVLQASDVSPIVALVDLVVAAAATASVSTTAVTWGLDVAGDAYESPVGLAAALVALLAKSFMESGKASPFLEADVIWSALESISGPKKGVWSVSVLLSAGSLQGAAGSLAVARLAAATLDSQTPAQLAALLGAPPGSVSANVTNP